MLALAYQVKYRTVNAENRVRVPESTKKKNAAGSKETRSSPFLSESKIAGESFQFPA